MDRKLWDGRGAVSVEAMESRRLMSSTYYVAPFGNDAAAGTSDGEAFATLQRAADAVKAGDTVVVRAGTYGAGFVMGWDSNARGTAEAPITFAADPGVVITGRNARTPDGINLEAGSDYVVIRGFSVNNASGTITRAGIRVVGSDHVSVVDNKADSNGRWGIFTGFADDLLIEGNQTSRSGLEHGIYVSNSGDRPVIRGNVSWGNRSCGIHMNGDASQGGDGIISGALVEQNVVYDNGAGGGSGINMDGVQGSRIQNNLVYGSRASGISLYRVDGGGASSGNVVANNTVIVSASGRWALNVTDGAVNNTVINNVLYNYGSFRGSVTISADSMAGLVSDHNAVMNRFQVGEGSVMSLAQWRAGTGQDRHSVVIGDPAAVFVDPARADWRLRAGSVAVDAGVSAAGNVTAPAYDVEGSGRVFGTMDIGAYELGGPLAGDANGDGRLNAEDFALVDRGRALGLSGWGNGDFNGDGVVDARDYLIITRAEAKDTMGGPPGGVVVDAPVVAEVSLGRGEVAPRRGEWRAAGE